MNLNKLKPSDFTDRPMGSILQNNESEIVAANIMVIRSKLGNKWPLTWAQYKARRISHGNDFSEAEEGHFKEVYPLIKDVLGAIAFSSVWASAARRACNARKAA